MRATFRSLLACPAGNVEAGMLGRNSGVGSAAPLDGATALNQAIVQVESMGMAAETAVMKRLVKESETLRLVPRRRGFDRLDGGLQDR